MLDEPIEQEIQGKKYKVEGFTLAVQQYHERYMQNILLEDLKSMKPLVAEDEYLSLLEKHARDRKRGLLSFGSDKWLTFLDEDEYFHELIRWCFLKYDPGCAAVVDKWMKEKPEELIELFRQLYRSKKNSK